MEKIRNPSYFIQAVVNYDILPKRLEKPFAFSLPWIEVMLGLLLFFSYQARIAAVFSSGLFIVFIVAIETNLARGRINLDCGCFGGRHRQVIGFKTILRNLVLIALCGLLAFWDGGLLVVDDLPMATQRLILDIYVIDILLPLALAAAGLFLLVRLIRQLARLVSLTSMEYRQ